MKPIVLPFVPKAVIFDMDGTLIDSEREVAAVMAQVLAPHGRVMSAAERDFVIGHAWGEIYAFMTAQAPVPLSLAALEEAVLAARLAGGQVVALPGAREAVRAAAQRFPTALVTGSSEPEARYALSALGILECFPVRVCAGDYRQGKPSPEPFLLAAQRLGVDPRRCLVLEDSQPGIRGARDAGACCLAVRAGNFAGQDQSAAHLILDSLEQLPGVLERIPS